MSDAPLAIEALRQQLVGFGWVTDVWVAGSLATGDYIEVSDLDLVAVVDGTVGVARRASLAAMHSSLDAGVGSGLDLGCVYVGSTQLLDPAAVHPTWTHGAMVARILSGVTRAELVLHGYAVLGRSPLQLLPPISDDDVRAAARAELTGYWSSATRRPMLWLNPVMVDLSLTSMARGRHAMATGRLLTKTHAIDRIEAPGWLVEQVRARRAGEAVVSPRIRAGHLAWHDASRTTAHARH